MRTLFVGDVHGCAAEFGEILTQADFHRDRDRLLLTGDAFSRGPEPVAVWQIVQETGACMVLGNHDARLLKQFQELQAGRCPQIRRPHHQLTLDRLQPLIDQLLPWLETVPFYIEEDAFLLVHAGINPEQGLAQTTPEEFLRIRLWPPGAGTEGPRWHEFYRPDDRVLIFGHDAPGGLVVKKRTDGRTCLIGLDSGCVYGGCLSAYMLEEDRILQVQSRQEPQF